MAGIWTKLSHRLIDTHCHLHHYPEPKELIQKLTEKEITVHLVTVKPTEYENCIGLTKSSPRIHPCIGLFPLYVKECYEDFDLFKEKATATQFIGEVGLDYTVEDSSELELQKNIFKDIIAFCHQEEGKVLSIHSRRAAEDTLAMIGPNFNGTAIMHWYSGPEHLIQNAPENVFFSVNTAMLKSRSGKKVIKTLKKEQVLTETDGPYVKTGESLATPEDIRTVIDSLSQQWSWPVEAVLEQIEKNYQRALGT